MKIDLNINKNQLVENDIKVLYWDESEDDAGIGYLALIDHRFELPFRIWDRKSKGKELNFNMLATTGYKNIKIIEPKYQVLDFFSLSKVLEEEGYKQSTKKKENMYSHSTMEYCSIDWKFIFSKCDEIFTREEAQKYFKKTWVKEVY